MDDGKHRMTLHGSYLAWNVAEGNNASKKLYEVTEKSKYEEKIQQQAEACLWALQSIGVTQGDTLTNIKLKHIGYCLTILCLKLCLFIKYLEAVII